MTQVRAWLESIGCGKYADAFEENDITPELLPDLSDADLKELGFTIGDRKRFKRAVARMGEAPAEQEQTGAATGEALLEPEHALVNPHAERRRLTVMFVDLVGSTVLSSKLDPEE